MEIGFLFNISTLWTYTEVAGFGSNVVMFTDWNFSGVLVGPSAHFSVTAKKRELSCLESAQCLPIWSYPMASESMLSWDRGPGSRGLSHPPRGNTGGVRHL